MNHGHHVARKRDKAASHSPDPFPAEDVWMALKMKTIFQMHIPTLSGMCCRPGMLRHKLSNQIMLTKKKILNILACVVCKEVKANVKIMRLFFSTFHIVPTSSDLRW